MRRYATSDNQPNLVWFYTWQSWGYPLQSHCPPAGPAGSRILASVLPPMQKSRFLAPKNPRHLWSSSGGMYLPVYNLVLYPLHLGTDSCVSHRSFFEQISEKGPSNAFFIPWRKSPRIWSNGHFIVLGFCSSQAAANSYNRQASSERKAEPSLHS